MKKTFPDILLSGFLVLVVAVFIFGFGVNMGVNLIKKMAIEEGVAQYVCNPTNGVTSFQFVRNNSKSH